MKLNSIVLLLTSTSAELVVLNQFDESECNGPPSTIITFKVNSPIEYSSDDNTPFAYDFSAPLHPYGKCGLARSTLGIPGDCCYSNLSERNKLFNSTMGKIVNEDFQDPLSEASSMANGEAYCKLISNDLSNMTLFGYNTAYIRANNKCNQGWVCSPDGNLVVYKNTFCENATATEKFYLNGKLNSDIMGNVTGWFVPSLSGGNGKAGWIASIPAIDHEFNSIFSEILFIVAIIAMFGAVVFAIYQLKIQILKTHIHMLVVQMLWLGYTIFMYIDTSFPHELPLYSRLTIQALLLNAATLSTSLYTANLLADVSTWNHLQRFALFTFIVFVHTGLTLGRDLSFLDLSPEDNSFLLFQYWASVGDIFPILMFFWDLGPPVWIIWTLTSRAKDTLQSHLIRITSIDTSILPILYFQLVNTLIFFFVSFFRNYTALFGSDTSLLSSESIMTMLFVIHTILNLCLVHRIRKILLKMSSNINSSQDTL